MLKITLTDADIIDLSEGTSVEVVANDGTEIELEPSDFEDEQFDLLITGETVEITTVDGDEAEVYVDIEEE